MISDDLFISAGHRGYLVNNVVRFNYQNDPSGNPRPTQDFTVASVVEQQNDGTWDYAIVRLNGNPGRIWGYGRIADRDEDVGDNVVIIQHPNGVPKVLQAGPVLDYSSPMWGELVPSPGGHSRWQLRLGCADRGRLLRRYPHQCGLQHGQSDQRQQRRAHDGTPRPLDDPAGVLAWQRGSHGWVWATSSRPPLTRRPPPITQNGTGSYTVNFPGVDEFDSSMHVTAYGSDNLKCGRGSDPEAGTDCDASRICDALTNSSRTKSGSISTLVRRAACRSRGKRTDVPVRSRSGTPQSRALAPVASPARFTARPRR